MVGNIISEQPMPKGPEQPTPRVPEVKHPENPLGPVEAALGNKIPGEATPDTIARSDELLGAVAEEGGVSAEDAGVVEAKVTERYLSPEERIDNAERLNKELEDILAKLPEYQEADTVPQVPEDILEKTFKLGNDTYRVADFRNSKAIPLGGFSIHRYPEGSKGVEVAHWGKGGEGNHPGAAERPQFIYEEFGDVSQYQRKVDIRDTNFALTKSEGLVNRLKSAVPPPTPATTPT